MLKTVAKSSNKKLGGCAATYRAGESNVYGTCPNRCPLKPPQEQGTGAVDISYLHALKEAVPPQGWSWTYTHFAATKFASHRVLQAILKDPAGTCINSSYDTWEEVAQHVLSQADHRAVVVRPSGEDAKVDVKYGIRAVRCPAEYNSKVTCNNCGGDKGPLCARPDRDYVIKFTAHGSGAKVISIRDTFAPGPESAESSSPSSPPSGGCYGNTGPVRLQWENSKGNNGDDPTRLTEFAQSLPPGTRLRHHVVGDVGRAQAT